MAFARRHRTDLSVIMLDVDHFKAVNDRHGHNAGDEVLTSIADQMRRSMRVEDVLARFGGEEIAIVLRTTDVSAAHLVAERLRRTVEASPARRPGLEIPVTVSAPGVPRSWRPAPRLRASCWLRPTSPCTPPSGPGETGPSL